MTFKKQKLEVLVDEIRDIYEPSLEENLPYIGLEHIEQQTLRLCGVGNSSDTQSSKRKFKKGDILFGTLRPYFRKVIKTRFDGVCSTDIAVLRPKNKSTEHFTKYFIADPAFIDFAYAHSNGTRMPRANWKHLSQTEWLIPDEIAKEKIGFILSAYDDLIENNTQRIKILEEVAQRIYREWFVNFRYPGHEKQKLVESELGMIPQGWKVIELGEKISFTRGKNITKREIIPGDVPVVAAGVNPAYYHNESNVKSPVVTISASGANAGFIRLYHEDIWASDCSYINKDSTKTIFYFYSLLRNRQVEVTALQRGSAQPHVYPKDVMRMLIVDAPEKLIIQFEEISKTIFNEIGNLKLKNNNLRQTRDLLLPRLISGELDVSELDIEIGEVSV